MTREESRAVRNGLIIAAIAAFGLLAMFAAGCLHSCSRGRSPCGGAPSECVADTVTTIDTITHVAPAPTSAASLGYRPVTLPRHIFPAWREKADTAIHTPADTAFVDKGDSITIPLPVEQKVYEAVEYRAYVSGTLPNLDSIYVYPRRETITIRKPPDRWHLGPTVGLGLGPHGLQPFVGLSLTYSLLSF